MRNKLIVTGMMLLAATSASAKGGGKSQAAAIKHEAAIVKKQEQVVAKQLRHEYKALDTQVKISQREALAQAAQLRAGQSVSIPFGTITVTISRNASGGLEIRGE